MGDAGGGGTVRYVGVEPGMLRGSLSLSFTQEK